jgi:Zn finger protein HypA/HybF involved in hydrogenase expression
LRCAKVEAAIVCRSCRVHTTTTLDDMDRLRCPLCGTYRVDAVDAAELLRRLERIRAERAMRGRS